MKPCIRNLSSERFLKRITHDTAENCLHEGTKTRDEIRVAERVSSYALLTIVSASSVDKPAHRGGFTSNDGIRSSQSARHHPFQRTGRQKPHGIIVNAG